MTFREEQKNIAELCKGSTTDSDSVCEGSNPSSATIVKPLETQVSGGFFNFSGNFEMLERWTKYRKTQIITV